MWRERCAARNVSARARMWINAHWVPCSVVMYGTLAYLDRQLVTRDVKFLG